MKLAGLVLLFAVGIAFPFVFQGDQHAELSFTGPNAKIAIAWLVAPLGAVAALVFAWIFFKNMKRADQGNEAMKKIAEAVRKGALAYLFQQYKVVAYVFVALVVVLSVMAFGFGIQHTLVPFAFLTGGFFSGLCGFLGMNTATQASNRTAQAASKSLNDGLQIAFRSGAVMGLVVVGFGLLDIAIWFYVCNNLLRMELAEVVVTMLAFGMGASTQALFARVGGGIYTKAADVGADLVGKVEAGIPEDDPRNPATIADNVGDNVGDVAGMGADLYESYCGSILSTAALGFATAQSMQHGMVDATASMPWVVLPMVIAGIGIFLSIAGIYMVRTGEEVSLKTLMAALFRGINGATILTAIGALFAAVILLNDSKLIEPYGFGLFGINKYIWGVWAAIVVGLVAGVIVAKAAEYYTSNDFAPTRGVAENAKTGPATVIIDGFAVGMMSTGIPILTIVLGMFLSFWLSDGFSEPIRGLYGIAIAAVGMLSTLGITLATDAYGPIADNAGGNATMAGLPAEVRERTDGLDALGNTTAATGKGFAIASAALTAMALLAAYVEEVRIGVDRIAGEGFGQAAPLQGFAVEDSRPDAPPLPSEFRIIQSEKKEPRLIAAEVASGDKKQVASYFVLGAEKKGESRILRVVPVREAYISDFMSYYNVTLMNPNVLMGIFIGAMMVFVFCAMTMKAVGRAAKSMVEEVRRQFREIPGIMEGKAEPDYARCVAISTAGAQREMILPSFLAILAPVVVGLVFEVSGVMGLLAGALSSGFAVAIMMAAAGGAWDNAKKWIEMGRVEGHGKGSSAHKAAVVGDTVGDPFKDTSGPSLNILIKLMTMVSIVFVGLTLAFGPKIAQIWK
jgi:K(+)-stimulated pyrophosphate-energized sodium pump